MDGVLDRLSIRSKIAVILILPVLACAVLGALRVNQRISTSRQADRVTKLTEFSLRGTNVAHELEHERGLAALLLDAPPQQANAQALQQALQRQQTVTDRAIDAYRGSIDQLDVRSLTQPAKQTLASALGHLDALANLRHDIADRTIGSSGALDQYSTTVADLLNANRELSGRIANPELAQAVGAFVAVSRIKELAALERELVSGVIARGRFGAGEFRSFTSTLATRNVLLSEFQATATPSERDTFVQTVVGPDVQRAHELQATVIASDGNGHLAIDPNQWWASTTAEIDLLHQVEQRLGIAAVSRSRSIERSANSRAAIDSLAVLAVLALAFGLSLMVARSMLRPLRLLVASAKDVAQNRLPGVVAKLQRSTGEPPDLSHEVEPVKVPSRDEVGEVAAAFNSVNQVAVRVAAEQAALRLSIGDIFLNLARRSQALIDRQLELIDELEEEADSKTLSSLFHLDHLATRMRRNAENLIVLSGAEPPRRWTEPIPLGEVARGAIAEVEDYQRVALVPMEEVAVPGHAVADIIHLLSELIENATSFSPPGTVVRVGGQPAATGYIIEVEDRGLGMGDDELQEANERLANPPTIDFAVSRMLGLFVVGRLARRYNIRVQLRHSSFGGITALVMLPSSVVLPLGPQHAAPPPGPFSPAPELVPPPGEPEPVMAEPLPIFEQARSDWFEAGGPATPTPYPPLAARFGAPDEQVEAPPPPRDFHAQVRPPMPSAPRFPAGPDGLDDEDPFSDWDEGPLPDPPAAVPFRFRDRAEAPGQHAWPEPGERRWPEPDERSRPEPGERAWPQPGEHGWPTPGRHAWPPPEERPGDRRDDLAGAEAPETTAGLPRRVPRANLAPGILAQRERVTREEQGDPQRAARSPEEVRSLLANYRAGIERGRRSASEGEGETAGWDAVVGNEHDEPR
jgi:HAMP domain-containing protein